MVRNVQILLETMLRCGGNCSGCALASTERMLKSEFDFSGFKKNALKINHLLLNYPELESVSIFLGQGDHFLMGDDEIEPFVEICAQIVPPALKHKTVVFITASAIAKEDIIKSKMDKFYDYSLKYNIPFFIQTVFDPKKITLHDNFKETYINNILYFKEKCGMTELTLNLGEDMVNQMNPQDFHDWVIEYGFKHVEMNWVMSKLTHGMWKNYSQKMFDWLKEWLLIYKKEHLYEINFIPFMSRQLLLKEKNIFNATEDIALSLIDNLYIDNGGTILLGQMGVVSNLTPMGERMNGGLKNSLNINDFSSGGDLYYELQQQSRILTGKIQKSIIKRPSCLDCSYKTVCSVSGSTAWFDYNDLNDFIHHPQSCPWNIKDFIEFLDINFSNQVFANTVFTKNPVQHLNLKENNNEVFKYFIDKLEAS